MSLLLNGSKTLSIAGTEMQCVEIYTGESYTLPFQFTYANTSPINCTGWTLSTTAKFWSSDTVTYSGTDTVVLGNLTLNPTQPSTGAGTYSANLTAAFTTAASGQGYIYIPADLTGGTGSPNATPVIPSSAASSANPSTLVVVTLGVSRTDPVSSKTDFNKEPIGFIVRYQ
jgi:hypothetical protein